MDAMDCKVNFKVGNITMIKLLVDCRMINASGIGIYTKELLKRFYNSDSLDVYILVNSSQKIPSDINIGNDKIINTTVHKYSLYGFFKNNKIIKNFDVYFIPFLSVPPVFVKKTKVFSTIHDLCPVAMRKFFGWKTSLLYLCMMLVQCLFSTQLIAISNFTKTELNKYSFGFFRKKIMVVTNGVRKIECKDSIQDNVPRREGFGICVGNVKPHKNIFPLVHYLSTVKFKNKLYIIGDIDGFSTGYSKKLFDKLPENVVFTGKISDEELHRYFKNADYMIFPSLYEGFGLPLLEAMQYGLRIMASDIPVFHEIADDSVLYFDPITFDNLDDLLNTNILDFDRDEGYKNVLQKYNWDVSANKIIGAFCEKNTYSE